MAKIKGLQRSRPWRVPRATAKRTPPAPCVIKRPSQPSNSSTFNDDPFLPCADAAAKHELETVSKDTPDEKIGTFIDVRKKAKYGSREAESAGTLKAYQRKDKGVSLINFMVKDCPSDVDATEKPVSVDDALVDVVGEAIGRDKEEVDGKNCAESPLKEDEDGIGEVFERQKKSKMEIFVGGLDMNVKEDDIRKIFAKMGEIVRLTLVRVDLTGTNDGYALVLYSCADDARRVLDKYTKVEICGRKCATAPVEGSILIYNIDKKWKNEDVIKLLKETGTEGIEKVSLVVDPDNVGHNLGYGFVELQTCKDAQNPFDCKNLQRKLDKRQKVNVKVFLLKPVSDEKDSSSSSFNKPNQPRNNRKTPGKSYRRRRSDIMDYKTAVAVQSIRQQAHWTRWQKRFGSGPVVAIQPHMLPTWNHPFPARISLRNGCWIYFVLVIHVFSFLTTSFINEQAGGYHTYSYHPGYINIHPSYPQRGYNPPPADSSGCNDRRRPARSFPGSSSRANNPRGDGLLPRPNTYRRQG